jgi:hypothetical protein
LTFHSLLPKIKGTACIVCTTSAVQAVALVAQWVRFEPHSCAPSVMDSVARWMFSQKRPDGLLKGSAPPSTRCAVPVIFLSRCASGQADAADSLRAATACGKHRRPSTRWLLRSKSGDDVCPHGLERPDVVRRQGLERPGVVCPHGLERPLVVHGVSRCRTVGVSTAGPTQTLGVCTAGGWSPACGVA